jgi:hypothetical protein
MTVPSKAQFMQALKTIRLRGRQLDILRAHIQAPGRAMTARRLAQSVGYQNNSGINLQFGLLAQQIGKALRQKDVDIQLLVSLVRPPAVTNKEWVLVMHSQLADAIEETGWIEGRKPA